MESFYQTLNKLGYTHPVHPTMVYLPIGCVMAAVIFAVLAVLSNRTSLLTSAKHCVTLALIAVVPTMLLGYMDWQHFYGGNWLFPIRMKVPLAGLLLVSLTITVVYNWKFNPNRKTILALYVVCLFNVVAIGYFGGELVFAGFAPQKVIPATATAEKKLQPTPLTTYADVTDIFQRICIRCHKGPGAPYGLQLDTYEHAMEGGIGGKVIVPGQPDKSELVLRLRGLSEPAMPYRMAKLPKNKIDLIARWIQQGAKKG